MPPPRGETIEVVFATLNRLLGVGIGEHLGYLLTGLWTILVAVSIVSTTAIAPWLGWIGLPIGVALLLGSLEFVGPNEKAAGSSPASSSRSPTLRGRSGSSRWALASSCEDRALGRRRSR